MKKRKIYTEEDVERRVREELDRYFEKRQREEEIERLHKRIYELEQRVGKLENPNHILDECYCMPKEG